MTSMSSFPTAMPATSDAAPAALATEARPRDVQLADLGTNTWVLRSRTWDRLKFEVEYSRQRGTTANAYLIRSDRTALLDPPGESFSALFLTILQQQIDLSHLDYLVLNHINANRLTTLRRLLALAPRVQVVCSHPAARWLRDRGYLPSNSILCALATRSIWARATPFSLSAHPRPAGPMESVPTMPPVKFSTATSCLGCISAPMPCGMPSGDRLRPTAATTSTVCTAPKPAKCLRCCNGSSRCL